MSFEVVELESPVTMVSTTLTITNNGMTDSAGVSYETTSKNLGSAHSGSLNGVSSWKPTYSFENENVAGRIEFTVKRGTGSYSSSWYRKVD